MTEAQKKLIAKSFSRSATRYDQAAKVQQQAGYDLLEKSRSIIGVNIDVIADVGCGTGYFADALVRHYNPSHYFGVDIAQGMLDVAASNNRHVKNTQWVCNDAENLPMDDESVDLIYANFSLQWCEDLSCLLAEFDRVLKPGGFCCFTSLGSHSLHELRQAWSEVDQLNHVNQFYDRNLWEVAIKNNHFSIINHYQSLSTVYFESVLSALRSLKDIGANVVKGDSRQALTGKQRFAQFVDAYEQLREEKGIPVTYDVNGWIIKK